MGQQTIAGQFPGIPANVLLPGVRPIPINLADPILPPGVPSAWTKGAAIITRLPIQPPLTELWSIVAWSISLYGYTFYDAATAGVSYGRLGRLYGGLVKGAAQTTGFDIAGARAPFDQQLTQFPADLSLTSLMWDGAQDPPFPALTTDPVLSPQSVSNTLPLPLQLASGEQASIGMWLTPSLVQNAEIYIALAQYVVTYDDGQAPHAGWGD